MDLSGKTFQTAQSFLQNASSLVSAYGLGSPFISGQALTTSLYSGTSQALSNSLYSGSLATSLSSSHAPFSNGHSTTSPSAKMPDNKKSYASPAPVFNRHKDSFPYGISGVPIPNYGYQGDVYQFTSNGYPRKSRTCSYCGKVFTRSTTRRYHEKRCPLLRAAVSSYMGDDNNSGSALQSRVRGAELASHSYTGQGTSLPPSLSGIGRSNDPQELATSVLKSPPVSEKRVSGDLISGYQTSVIVKSEPHELEGSVLSSYSDRKQSLAQESSENRLRFSPESAGSGHKLEPSLNLSPGYASGMDLTKSPSNTSIGHNRDSENITSVLNDSYLRERYKVQSDSELEMGRGQLPSISSLRRHELIPRSHASYSIDLTHDNDASEGTENRMEVPDVIGDSIVDGRDDDDDDYDRQEKSEYNGPQTMESGEIDTTDREQSKVLGSHKCGICGKCFESSGKLHLHEQIHTKFRPYCCKFCGQRFAKSALRIAHEKTHNGVDTTHICAVCGSSFTRKYSLKLHMHRWHQEGPWLCRHCGKASLTQMELKTHLYSHNLPRMERESLLYMPDVPLNYGAAKDLDIDGQDVQDLNESPSGGTSAQAQQEGSDVAAQQETEMCTECGRDFPKGYMRYHLKSHEAQKPYSCPICAKRFGYKNNMKSHIKLHTGVKPFCCKVCGAKFTRGSTLRRHARRHGIIADSVWDLFVKSNYGTGSKTEAGKPLIGGKMDTSTTSNSSEGIANNPMSSSAKPGIGNVAGDTNYLDSSISPKTTHATRPSLYPLYASLGQIPPPGLYPSLSSSTSYLQRIPHSLGYSASSHTPPQQMDALNLSLQKAHDQASDQSSYSNMSAERSRSRSRSLSGSDQRRPYPSGKFGIRDIGVQVHTCCHNKETSAEQQRPSTPRAPLDAGGVAVPGSSTTPVPESPSQNMAVMPYIVTSPSQRPSNVDSTSPALSVSSIKDYSLETISSLISSGRMFKCFHCECYFSEYAMYRIHSKLHTRDASRPFVCLVCGEDCYDRVYFALHLSEHLR